ncbi:MAG: hypothetical protein ABSH20_23550 [Tepidisphaeraceae bacterium]
MSAASIGKLQAGSMTGAAITLGGNGTDLGTLAITGSLTDSTIRSTGNIGNVTVGGAARSSIFAGVSAAVSSALPGASDFVTNSAIASFTDTGKSTFSDTFISAETIGTAALADVTTSNGGHPFGIATESLRSFALTQPRQKVFSWTSKKPVSLLNALPHDLHVEVL